jgi:twitching motility protein PilT
LTHASSVLDTARRVDPVEALLSEMNELRASDLFLSEGRAPSMRVDGGVRLTPHPPLAREDLDAFLGRVLRPAQREHLEKTGHLDAGFTHATHGRFRVHVHAQRSLLGAVVRAVPSGQLAFEKLLLPPVLRHLAERPPGSCSSSGRPGRGRARGSTRLASLIDQRPSRGRRQASEGVRHGTVPPPKR